MVKNDEQLIEQYAGLAGALNRVNQEVPEIFAMYQETKQLFTQTQDEISDIRETLKRQIEDARRMTESLRQSMKEAESMRREAAKLKAQYEQKIAEAEEIRRQMLISEPLLEHTLDDLTRAFDYARSDSVAEIFRTCRHIGPVVVRRPNWPAEQGFWVQSVSGNRVSGVSFRDGEIVPDGPTPRGDSQCRIFQGPSQRDIFRYALRHAAESGEKTEE